MKFRTLQNYTCTIYAAKLHNLVTFPVQFVQIFALFFQKFQPKSFTFNILYGEKLFLTCTNRAAINPISSDNQSFSTCTISAITCTTCSPFKANITHYQQTKNCINDAPSQIPPQFLIFASVMDNQNIPKPINFRVLYIIVAAFLVLQVIIYSVITANYR
jgi:hypothetical protein